MLKYSNSFVEMFSTRCHLWKSKRVYK
uniref:Uncharacterized protein n=1 Tax=Rhizophora mucronata TaxID=61149 RepID=A0A2P2P177_RHIMU